MRKVSVHVKLNDGSVIVYNLKDYFPGSAAMFVRGLDNVKAWKLVFN
jgi:hypothetical protein